MRRFVTTKAMVSIILGMGVIHCSIALLTLFVIRPTTYLVPPTATTKCFLFEDMWAFVLDIVVLGAMVLPALHCLRTHDDALRIKFELKLTLAIWSLSFCVLYFVPLMLARYTSLIDHWSTAGLVIEWPELPTCVPLFYVGISFPLRAVANAGGRRRPRHAPVHPSNNGGFAAASALATTTGGGGGSGGELPLDTILGDAQRLEVFRRFAEKCLAVENVLFWEEVQSLRALAAAAPPPPWPEHAAGGGGSAWTTAGGGGAHSLPPPPPPPDAAVARKAEHLYKTYVRADALNMINISARVRRGVEQRYAAGERSAAMFSACEATVKRIMHTDIVFHFKKTAEYQQLLAQHRQQHTDSAAAASRPKGPSRSLMSPLLRPSSWFRPSTSTARLQQSYSEV